MIMNGMPGREKERGTCGIQRAEERQAEQKDEKGRRRRERKTRREARNFEKKNEKIL